jgi:hypothetical protein
VAAINARPGRRIVGTCVAVAMVASLVAGVATLPDAALANGVGGHPPGIEPAATCLPLSHYGIWVMNFQDAVNDTIARDGNAPSGSVPSTTFGYGVSVAAPGPLENDRDGPQALQYSLQHFAPLTVPAHASHFSWEPDGSFSVDFPASYTGGDSFTYTIQSNTGHCSDIGTITIPPAGYDHLLDDGYTVFADTPFTPTAGLAVCDTHAAPTGGSWPACGVLKNDVASFVRAWRANGASGSLSGGAATFATAHGSVALRDNGSFTYTPAAGYVGTDSFQYRTNTSSITCNPVCTEIFKSKGTDGAFATVRFTVQTKPPEVTQNSPVVLSVNENTLLPSGFTPLTIAPATLQSGQPDTSAIVGVNGSAPGANSVRTEHGTLALTWAQGIITSTGPGTVALGPCPGPSFPFIVCQPTNITSMTYTPDVEYSGPDTFSYMTFNTLFPGGRTAVLNYVPIPIPTFVTVNEVISQPSTKVHPLGLPVTVQNHTNFLLDAQDLVIDPDNLALIEQATLFQTTTSGPNPPTGALVNNFDGTFTFVPFTAGDASSFVWYTIMVPTTTGAVNTIYPNVGFAVPPYAARNDSYFTQENVPVTANAAIGVLANDDPPPVGAGSVSLQDSPDHGTVTLNADGSFVYTPETYFHGIDSFTYLNNGYTGQVDITMDSVLQAPVVHLNDVCVPAPGDICFGDYDDRAALDEGDTAQLRGSITDPEFTPGTLTIDWGDGTVETFDYPCAAGTTDCPFQSTPTWNICIFFCSPDNLDGPQYFEFHHLYENNPPDGAPKYTIGVKAEASNGMTSTTATGPAFVADLPPALTIAPECSVGVICIGNFSVLTQAIGGNVVVRGRVTDPGTDTGRLSIDWGDGTGDSIPLQCNGTDVCPAAPTQGELNCSGLFGPLPKGCGGFVFTHHYDDTYGGPSSYPVTLTARTGMDPLDTITPGLIDTENRTATVVLRRDEAAPTAAQTLTPPANENGWNNTPAVTVNWNWSDSGGSQIDEDNCTDSSPASGQGEHSVAASCADNVGNVGNASQTVKIDTSAPVASPTAPTPNSFGWHGSAVTVDWNWTDTGGSGIDLDGCDTSTFTDDAEGVVTLHALCFDRAGNAGSATYEVKVDMTAPNLAPTVIPNPVLLNGVASASANASDSPAGIASSSCGSVTTTALGLFTVVCTTTDRAGHTSIATADYVVGVEVSRLGAPKPAKVIAGTVLPVRFQLKGAGGVLISDSLATSLAAQCAATVVIDGLSPACATYDAKVDTWAVNIKTPSTWTSGMVVPLQIRVRVGTTIVGSSATSFTVTR